MNLSAFDRDTASQADRYYRLAEKVYDQQTGDAQLECAVKANRHFDITIYCGKQDLTIYDLSPLELVDIAHALEALAASVDPLAVLQRHRR